VAQPGGLTSGFAPYLVSLISAHRCTYPNNGVGTPIVFDRRFNFKRNLRMWNNLPDDCHAEALTSENWNTTQFYSPEGACGR